MAITDRSTATRVAAVAGAVLVVAGATSWLTVQGGVAPLAIEGSPAFGVGRWAAVVERALGSWCWLAPIALAIAGYAAAVRRWVWPGLAWSAAVACGVAVWGWLGLTSATLGAVGAGWAWAWVVLGMAAGALAWREWRAGVVGLGRWDRAGLSAWCGVGLGLLAVGAACAPGSMWRVEAMGYDVLSYHLQLPREWLAAGRLSGLEHNVYSHLPSLVESMMMQAAALRGSGADGVLPSTIAAQWLHAGFALLTAWCLADAVTAIGRRDRRARHDAPKAGAIVAATWLVVPWVVVLGSMAYNEMAVTAFAAAACVMVARSARGRTIAWQRVTLVGFVLGAAVLSKPTAGPMIAVPLGVALIAVLAVRRRRPLAARVRVGVTTAAVLAVIGLLALSPYLARNAVQRGNPVFPFAGGVLGHGHWDDALAERWDRAHGLDTHDERPALSSAVWRQWLGNQGYGAFGGRPTPPERDNVARFTVEGGLPVVWLLAGIGAIAGLVTPRYRVVTASCLAWLALQLVFWATSTHLQSRFLVVTLLPGLLLIGVGLLVALRLTPADRRSTAAWLAALVIVLPIATTAYLVVQSQPRPAIDDDGQLLRDPAGRTIPVPVAFVVDAWPLTPRGVAGMHPVNGLPPDTHTLIVADNATLLYLTNPVTYATPFDPNPLGEIIRARGPDPHDITAALRDAGFTHVYLGAAELARLHRTYGFDPDVTFDRLRDLIASGWRPVAPQLYALPAAGAGVAPDDAPSASDD